MKTESEINQLHQKISTLIEEQRLMEALELLNALCSEQEGSELHTRITSIQTSYHYMLQYLRQGMPDPERGLIYQGLLRDAYALSDLIHLHLLDQISLHAYHRKYESANIHSDLHDLKTFRHHLESFSDHLAVSSLVGETTDSTPSYIIEHDDTCCALFEYIWKNRGWTKHEVNEAKEMLSSPHIIATDLALMVSAVTMSLLECFDRMKLVWLLDAYSHQDLMVSRRALVGIFFTLSHHYAHLTFYPDIESRLSLMADDATFRQGLESVFKQIIQSQQTERISQKMREEILPEMMKSIRKTKGSKWEMQETDADEEDLNPDWNLFENPKIGDQIRQMGELQMKGADVNYSTFSSFKHIPFFNHMAHWFMPYHAFTPLTASLESKKKTSDLIKSIVNLGMLCDSDKYSMSHMMSQISNRMEEGLLKQFTGIDLNLSDLNDETKESLHLVQTGEDKSRYYLQDLYRFFTLSPLKNEFDNPFTHSVIDTIDQPFFVSVFNHDESFKHLADLFFSQQQYDPAIRLYSKHIARYTDDADSLQKIGYCYQKKGLYNEALTYYNKADIIKPDTLWTIRHSADCYKQIEHYKEALKLYQKIECIQPDNLRNLFCCGSCLLYLNRTQEALNYFYKIDYINPDIPNTWRAIGWGCFVCAKYEQADAYYDKLIAREPTTSDYLNAGHLAWIQKNTERATTLYKRASTLCKNHDDYRELFLRDSEILKEKGIDAQTIALIIDLVFN